MTIEKLRKDGHQVVPFEIKHQDVLELISVYVAFANHASIPGIKDLYYKHCERLNPAYNKLVSISNFPNWLKRFVAWFLETFTWE
jgi:hypothetical protein